MGGIFPQTNRGFYGRGTLKAMAVAICIVALFVIAAPRVNARPGHAAVSPTSPPQAAVISLSVISAKRAARTLQTLFPHDRIRVDVHANAVIVVGPPDDLQQMRTIVQGIDVKNPQQPNAEVVPLHVLRPGDVVGRLHQLYPAAHIEAASKQSLLVRATPQDLNEIKALISSLDVAQPTVAPSSKPADSVRVNYADPRRLARAIEHEVPSLRASVSGSTVVLVGSADDIQKAKTLSAGMDAPPFGSKYTQVYRLNNVDATSVGDLVQRSYPSVHVTVDKSLNALSVLGIAGDQARIAAAIAQLDAAQASGTTGSGAAGPAYGDGNIDVVDLSSAMPGQNGAMSTTATDLASAVQQATHVEIGCEIYCNAGGCGYRKPTAGDPLGVTIDYDTETAGSWHTHISGDDPGHDNHHINEMDGIRYALESNGIKVPNPLPDFTSTVSNGKLWEQDFTGPGSSSEPYEIH